MNGVVTTHQLKTFKIFYKYAKDKFDCLYLFIDIKNNKNLLNKYEKFIKEEKNKSPIKIFTKENLFNYYEEKYFMTYYKNYMSTFNKVYFIKFLLDEYYLKNFFFIDDDTIIKNLNYNKSIFFGEPGIHISIKVFKNNNENFYKKWIYQERYSHLKTEQLLSVGQFYITGSNINIFYNKMSNSINEFLEDFELNNFHKVKKRGKRNSNSKIFYSDCIYLNYLFNFLDIKKENKKSDVLYAVNHNKKLYNNKYIKEKFIDSSKKIIHFNIIKKMKLMNKIHKYLINKDI